jgi:hypothetical protein
MQPLQPCNMDRSIQFDLPDAQSQAVQSQVMSFSFTVSAIF